MEYAPEFYKKENITGFTGNLNGSPTVHFQNGSTFGYIVQRRFTDFDRNHRCHSGRAAVMKPSVSISNVDVGAKDKTQKYLAFLKGERSSIFISSFQKANDTNIDILAKAIQKERYLRALPHTTPPQ